MQGAWGEHLRQFLNRCDPPTLAGISEAEQDLDIEFGPITIHQVKDTIKRLRNEKAPADDNVHAEWLKGEQAAPQLLLHHHQLLQRIIQDVWDKEVMLEAWKRGAIIKPPSKGNLSDCNNWRGITPYSITSKDFCRIIHQRITTAVDKLLHQEQTSEKIMHRPHFALRLIIMQPHEWNSYLYVVFVDYERAVDSLHRPSLHGTMKFHRNR